MFPAFKHIREIFRWGDIRAIGEQFDVLVDLLVNHISRESEYFQDFLEKGRTSEYADMFITLDKNWSDGKPVQEDVDKMFLRRPLLHSEYSIGNSGRQERE